MHISTQRLRRLTWAYVLVTAVMTGLVPTAGAAPFDADAAGRDEAPTIAKVVRMRDVKVATDFAASLAALFPSVKVERSDDRLTLAGPADGVLAAIDLARRRDLLAEPAALSTRKFDLGEEPKYLTALEHALKNALPDVKYTILDTVKSAVDENMKPVTKDTSTLVAVGTDAELNAIQPLIDSLKDITEADEPAVVMSIYPLQFLTPDEAKKALDQVLPGVALSPGEKAAGAGAQTFSREYLRTGVTLLGRNPPPSPPGGGGGENGEGLGAPPGPSPNVQLDIQGALRTLPPQVAADLRGPKKFARSKVPSFAEKYTVKLKNNFDPKKPPASLPKTHPELYSRITAVPKGTEVKVTRQEYNALTGDPDMASMVEKPRKQFKLRTVPAEEVDDYVKTWNGKDGLAVTPSPDKEHPTHIILEGNVDPIDKAYADAALDRKIVDLLRPTSGGPFIILVGGQKRVDNAELFLDQIDVAPPQVIIEARLIEVEPEAVENMGIVWTSLNGLLTSVHVNESVPPERNTFRFGTFNRTAVQLQADINALIRKNRARVLSDPTITVVNKTQAEIFAGEQVQYVADKDLDAAGRTLLQAAQQDIGVQLVVTPTIHLRENAVTLNLKPKVSTLLAFEPLTANTSLPRVLTRRAETTVRLNDNDMLAIGGLISEEEIRTMQKVPLLGDLPLLGSLFRNHRKEHRRTEVTLLLSVRIVHRGEPKDEDKYRPIERGDPKEKDDLQDKIEKMINKSGVKLPKGHDLPKP